MARSDYAHWNEDADYMWWQEEGRHATNWEPDIDDFYDDFDMDMLDAMADAAAAQWDELGPYDGY